MSNDFKTFVTGTWIIADDDSDASEMHFSAFEVMDAISDDRVVIRIGVGLKIISTGDIEKGIFYTSESDAQSAAALENGEDAEQAAA